MRTASQQSGASRPLPAPQLLLTDSVHQGRAPSRSPRTAKPRGRRRHAELPSCSQGPFACPLLLLSDQILARNVLPALSRRLRREDKLLRTKRARQRVRLI